MRYEAKGGTIFTHTTDFSGEIVIMKDKNLITIPGNDILELVAAQYILPKKISKLESLNTKQLLED